MSKGSEKKEDIVLERIYTIPLKIAYYVPRGKRTPRAVRFLKEFIMRHMKTDKVIITPEVNEILWSRGIQKPPRRIRVRVTKNSEGEVKVYPFMEKE
ncbi:MAG: 60S ribosomal protein L31 [archaeon YNP-WB-040]|jgi:large subunit ribosomal protein L31e|nr:60S ribosomal protein L31 [Candidatus Culexarchaeum yellowstonense]